MTAYVMSKQWKCSLRLQSFRSKLWTTWWADSWTM